MTSVDALKRVKFNLWPNGVNKAVSLSYDDGDAADMRLAELFDRYGMKATFHLVSAWIDEQSRLTEAQVRELSKRFEISAHMHTHPFPSEIPPMVAAEEILENKRRLEDMAGTVVRGMSYPYGQYDDAVVSLMRACGMEYSRTVQGNRGFYVPADFLRLHPTCHHNDIGDSWERFAAQKPDQRPLLYYLWGHSFEFVRQDNWNVIEDFCQKAGGHADMWYATSIEVCEYITAQRGLKCSADLSRV